MHKFLWLILVIALLSSCSSRRGQRTTDDSFVGMSEKELVTIVGPPDSYYEMGKEKFLIYNKNASQYYGGNYVPMNCKITFVFYRGALDNWHFEGNMCDAVAENIDLH